MAVPKTVARHHSTASQRRSLRLQLCSCYVLNVCRGAAACATRSQTAPHKPRLRRAGMVGQPAPCLPHGAIHPHGSHMHRGCPPTLAPTSGPRSPSAQDLPDRALDHSRPPLRHLSEPRRSDRMPGPAFPRHRPLPAVPPAFVRTAPERPPPDRPGRVRPAAAPPVLAAFVRRAPAPPFREQPRQHPSARVLVRRRKHPPTCAVGRHRPPNGICPNRAGGAGQPDRPVRSRARAQRLGRRTARRRPPPSRRDLPPLPVSRLGPG